MSEMATPTPAAPALHDVSDDRSVAIFDPERVDGAEAHWIQMDRDHAIPSEEWR